MNPQKHLQNLEKLVKNLSDLNTEYKTLSEDYAQAEYDYNLKYYRTLIDVKGKETAGLTPSIAKGMCAEDKFKLTLAEMKMKAQASAIKNCRTAIDTERSILTWLRSEKDSQ